MMPLSKVDQMNLDVLYLKEIYAKCDKDKSQPGCASHGGHEPIKFKERLRLESGSMPNLLKYMKDNGGGCEWGKFPILWNKYFPAT